MPAHPTAADTSVRAHNPFPLRLGLALAAAGVIYVLFLHNLNGVGLLGPDEPRYTAIGREMARSGDWITPRLWGSPWFEKPALLYWMTALGFRLNLGTELAPRLPVALLSVAFLLFYYWWLRREFGRGPAFYSSLCLATSAGWLAFSFVAVTDLPLTATFSAAMLLALPWIARGERRVLTPAAALLGLAVLAKGLVPLVLALPLLWCGRRRWRDWLRPGPVLAFAAVALPWYLLCTLRNGVPFLEDFFLKHHFSRFASDALQHRQPFWYYLPVTLAGLFPWTPLAPLLAHRNPDPRRRFLLLWALFALVFFSAALNKLPGYALPLFPALCALLGLRLAEVRRAPILLALCGLLLGALPVVGAILPAALARGIRRVSWTALPWPALGAAAILAITIYWLEKRERRGMAGALLLAAITAGVLWLKVETFPRLDTLLSARPFWTDHAAQAGQLCVKEPMHRTWRYNLNYYSVTPLPDCGTSPHPLAIRRERETWSVIRGQ